MYRICLAVPSGKLLWMQSGGWEEDNPDLSAARLDTLRQNALNSGLAEGDFEVKWVTDAEWAVIKEAQPKAVSMGVLSTDLWTIPADGVTFATVTFTTATPVYFAVNNDLHLVEPVESTATLEITADGPGPIRVELQNKQLTITAEAI